MKRKDLVLGERYAVFAPSQREKGYMFSEYHAKGQDIVTVLDLEPRYISSYSRNKDAGEFTDAEGRKYRYDYDRVFRIPDKSLPEYKGRGWGERPGSNVLVLEREPGWGGREDTYTLAVVPLSNIAMTEAEYLERVAQNTKNENAARIARRKAQEAADERTRQLIDQRNSLAATLEEQGLKGFKARTLDGTTVLAAESFELLEAFVIQAANDARSLEYICNTTEDGEQLVVDAQLKSAGSVT